MSSIENTTTAAEASTQPQQDAIPTKPEPKPMKKRPRPAHLDLKNATHNDPENMSQFAIKCLSPGLPPLDPAMQSTFLISKSIEAQQRQLIASRQTPTGLTAPMESLSIPSSTKRLKRNAPPPLNLSSTTPIRPTIMSAPSHHFHQFQQYFTPHTAGKPTFNNNNNTSKKRVKQFHPSFTPITPYGVRKPLMTSIPYSRPTPGTATYIRNGIKTGVPKSAIPPRTGIPRTAGGGGVGRYRGFRMKREEGVVDVFTQGERMAPLVAQPLSAQREFFDHGEISIRSARIPPKSATESKPSIPKIIKEDKINEESESDDVESNAIEPDAQEGLIRKSEVVGELKILNNVFRFGFERVGDDEDKQRFLNHCSRAWEEFVKLGN